jgi:hypothetical protein
MDKVGRNDPCPCGSGKKYKKCHLQQRNNNAGSCVNTHQSITANFDDLLASNSSVQILGLLGALQLHPENHGRNFRLEQLCLQTLRQFDLNDEKSKASWEKLKEVIVHHTDGKAMEDPLSNAFTEIAIFEQGNYIVYPGIYDGFTDILNLLTECIFLVKHNLDGGFIKKVRDAIGLLLFMSESLAHKAGHQPFIYKEGESGNIEFPAFDKTAQYIDASYFTRAYLKKVCDTYRYDIRILEDFIVRPGMEDLQNDNPDENIVNFKPLIAVRDGVLLYMPTGILNSLITYIYQKAKDYKCYDRLMELLYDRQFHLTQVALTKTGWFATDIKLPKLKKSLPIKEAVFQFDNQKLAYLCYIKTAESPVPDGEEKPTVNFHNPYEDRTAEVVQFLSTLEAAQPFGVFCLYIIGETANDYYFMWSKPLAGNQSLALKYRELWTITHSSHINSLTLWKFAKCYSRTNELARIMAMGGAMDAYAIYRKNHGSLLHSDEENPLGGMLMIVNGSSDDFRREVQKQQHEHAVPIFYHGQMAYAKVARYKDYAPIYIEREVSNDFRIVIENYKMPIWLTNPQTKGGKESWATYTCEAVAFWLNKMVALLSPYLNEQSLIQFEVEIQVADELMDVEQFIIKEVALEDIKITTATNI